MAIEVTTSNESKLLLAQLLAARTLKAILLTNDFVFDKDVHSTISHADIISYQLPTGYGYVQNDKVLEGVQATKDNDTDKAYLTFTNPVWTAAGGQIAGIKNMLIYDSVSGITINNAMFETTYIVSDGSNFSPKTIKIAVA